MNELSVQCSCWLAGKRCPPRTLFFLSCLPVLKHHAVNDRAVAMHSRLLLALVALLACAAGAQGAARMSAAAGAA